MVNILRQIHRYYALFIIFLFFILFYPLYFVAAKKEKWYGLLNNLRTANSLLCSVFIGIFFRFTYEEELDSNQTYVICGNHTSNLDIMIFCFIAKGRFHYMGKEELLKNPVLKIFFSTIDIPVNRDSKMSAFRAFKRAGENLQKGMSLVIFPEGKIDEDQYPPLLAPFKNGPFRLAIDNKVPLVAVTVTDAWKKMWDDGAKYGTRPGICDIYIHTPIPTSDLTAADADLLKDQVFDLIKTKLVS
ncbi:lysophospholipid acyltransferase family protein [Pedobacter sp. MR2016-24]|uniref:lysophospholipid acyltransferase family protein n=1 Tax=Pedobacter sp. MR2016-24 TaxID=2994466 RepID=UPI00224718DD|nr:lysophospholipid acyltransferase family protein [Pedobacter sp. MR2016-24]MCX2483949.1 lysophospholipid acyltransferase family protein [Pedobacter sp. MR2016-24]